MTTIVLVRHGHVAGIVPERFRGRTELALSRLGVAQARALAREVAARWPVAALFSSPMGRCLATAAAIAGATGVPVAQLAALNDLDYGAWQGRPHAAVRRAEPALYAAWLATPHLVRFPGGESLQDLAARAAEGLRQAVRRARGRTVVLVGHESLNRAMLLHVLEQPLSAYWRLAQDCCCINVIEVPPGGRPLVRSVNECRHLAGVTAAPGPRRGTAR